MADFKGSCPVHDATRQVAVGAGDHVIAHSKVRYLYLRYFTLRYTILKHLSRGRKEFNSVV